MQRYPPSGRKYQPGLLRVVVVAVWASEPSLDLVTLKRHLPELLLLPTRIYRCLDLLLPNSLLYTPIDHNSPLLKTKVMETTATAVSQQVRLPITNKKKDAVVLLFGLVGMKERSQL